MLGYEMAPAKRWGTLSAPIAEMLRRGWLALRTPRLADHDRAAQPIRTFLLLQREQFILTRAAPDIGQVEDLYDSLPFWEGERWLRAWANLERSYARVGEGDILARAIDRCLPFVLPRR